MCNPSNEVMRRVRAEGFEAPEMIIELAAKELEVFSEVFEVLSKQCEIFPERIGVTVTATILARREVQELNLGRGRVEMLNLELGNLNCRAELVERDKAICRTTRNYPRNEISA